MNYCIPPTAFISGGTEMKRIIALALVAITAVCALAGCSSLKGDEKGANISVYMTSYPYCLDPAVVQLDSEVTQILGLIYEGLTEIDSSGKVVGALAKNWYGYYDKVYDEYQMYFELKDTCWNDGRKVSADQIVYAWKRILDPDFDSPYASLLYPIKNAKAVKSGAMTSDDLGIAAVDDTLLCVTFECDYDISLFAEQIACTGLVPLREDIVTDVEEGVEWDSSAATMACNGPYSVKNLEEGIRVVLERNNGYMRDDEARNPVPHYHCLSGEHHIPFGGRGAAQNRYTVPDSSVQRRQSLLHERIRQGLLRRIREKA